VTIYLSEKEVISTLKEIKAHTMCERGII